MSLRKGKRSGRVENIVRKGENAGKPKEEEKEDEEETYKLGFSLLILQ